MRITSEMKTVKKGTILAMQVVGIESNVEMPNITKFGDRALRMYWDLKSPNTASGDVTAVYTVMDDGMYGEGKRAIRELLVKTDKGNAWLFPVKDLADGRFEYEVTIGKEKAVIKVTAEIEVFDSRAAFKAAMGKEEKAVKASKKALKPKKDTENTENSNTDEVSE